MGDNDVSTGLMLRTCCLFRLRRALENTCKPIGGDAPDAVLTYGRGLLQASPHRLPRLCHSTCVMTVTPHPGLAPPPLS